MSQKNVEILRPIYAEWQAGNLAAGTELLDDDIVSVWPSEFPTGGSYRGTEGHARAMREWLSAWKDFHIEAEDFIDAGDSVIVPFRVHARGKGSAVEVERRWAHVWTIRNGKAVRFEVHLDRAEALEAVGLWE